MTETHISVPAVEAQKAVVALSSETRLRPGFRSVGEGWAHETADVDESVSIGPGTVVWHYAQILAGAVLGSECTVGRGVFINSGAKVGDRVKIQNFVHLGSGVRLDDGVFIGPQAVLAGDAVPRSVTVDGALKTRSDWIPGEIVVGRGASIGTNATVVPESYIGDWAMVGAGAVLRGRVEAYELVVGVPAKHISWVCACGTRVRSADARCCVDR
jgi:UDP-2-acetamido-3-amino-2,3-dideoxy-glucuronate N-acetyltransferase